jgi:hypothetical protein
MTDPGAKRSPRVKTWACQNCLWKVAAFRRETDCGGMHCGVKADCSHWCVALYIVTLSGLPVAIVISLKEDGTRPAVGGLGRPGSVA